MKFFFSTAAEGLGIKRIVPAYRKLYIAPNDLKTGVSFASGGAGVDPVTSEMLVNFFIELVIRLRKMIIYLN